MVEPSGGLGLLERVHQVGQGSEVDLAPVLGGRDRQADRQVRLADPGRTGDVVLTNPLLSSATPGIRYAVVSWNSAVATSGVERRVLWWVLPDGTRTEVPEVDDAGGREQRNRVVVSSPTVSVSGLGALRLSP